MSDELQNAERGTVRASDRYQLEAILGQGGMAVVYAARDRTSDRRVALKRMRLPARADDQARYLALFEREYLTLVQLRHPRIVDVYDYGVDDDGPYYTMELLDGGDLLQLAPVDWRSACSYARDVCSALALLHSRRMLHRDLHPKNVRRTSDGTAKLIDFGAMMPFGASRELVGTLPYLPPEAVHQQPLDARTDLYALGATLYYILAQRHAYPARDVSQLRDFWRSRPRRIAELTTGVPEALDDLISDLMQLEPSARPSNAAEVMARLGAIAGLRSSEQVTVAQAYLSNPTLVGHSVVLTQARKQMLRAVQRRGSAWMLRGAPGMGRSRLLDAFVLEGQLAGLVVLRADAESAPPGNYGVVRTLAAQLANAVGSLAQEVAEPILPLLGHALPALIQDRTDVTLEPVVEPEQHHRRVQQVLRHFFVEVAKKRPLLLAIDDVPKVDESSAAFCALLAQEVAESGIVIVTTVSKEDERSSAVRGAMDLLVSASTPFELKPLDLPLTEELLSAVFGEVPNVSALARYVYAVTGGAPRDVMRLAQHLVSEDVVRYHAGQWVLPRKLDASSLPASMAEALSMRVRQLSAAARALALPFALEPTQSSTFVECGQLVAETNAARLMQTLDELTIAEVLSYANERYNLSQHGWAAPLLAAADEAQTQSTHLALAQMFERRGDSFRTAQHLLGGGSLERGIDMLLQHAVESEQRTDVDVRAFHALLEELPHDWLSTYEQALRLIGELGRPAVQRDVLYSRLAGLIAHRVSETNAYGHIAARLAQLYHDSGLDRFAALSSQADFGARLKQALHEATVRYQTTPPNERVLDPGTAIKQLPKTMIAALGSIAYTCSYEECRQLPSLAPLVPLSPALGVVQLLAEGLSARVAGQSADAIEKYQTLLARMDQPDRAGLTPTHHLATKARVIQGIGTLEAAMGKRSCLARAVELESLPAYAAQAPFIKHIYHVWQGNVDEAARCKQEIELSRIESNAQYGFEGHHLSSELTAYALGEDLTLIKRATDAVVPRAAIHEAWQPVLHYGRGEYLRISGNPEGALQELERALSKVEEGRHQIWACAAGAHLRTLVALARFEEARTQGTAYLALADRNRLGYARCYIRMPLALALTKLGEHDEAIAMAERVIDELLALESTGLNLAAAYEVRARIDLERGDRASFEHHAALCGAQSKAGERRLIGAKDQRHVLHGSLADPSTVGDRQGPPPQLTFSLENFSDPSERAHSVLAHLTRESGARGGVLYTCTATGVVRAALVGEAELTASLDDWANDYVERELEHEDATGDFSEPAPANPLEARNDGVAERRVPVLLTHQSDSGFAITGVALLITTPDAAFVYPSRVAAELSRSLAQAGDVTVRYG